MTADLRPATELAAAVRDGSTTAVEAVRGALDRIAALDGRIGAFEVVRHEAALAEAADVDARADRAELPLAGVPVAIKDVVDVAGELTRHGSAALPAEPADADDLTVARLRASGAVVVGKTRGPELSIWGASDNVRGEAVNPWDTSRVSGGSSGGSAAAVAAGMVPLALGSDGLGSIRIPAAACGLVGIKPGSGVVPMEIAGRDEHWFGMSQYGPLATTVADLALALDVLAGADRYRRIVGAEPRPLRVAVSTAPPALGVVTAKAYRDAVGRAGSLLARAGHHVVQADPPYSPRESLAILSRWTMGAARDADDLGLDLAAAEPRTRTHVRVGRFLERVHPVRESQAASWRARLEGYFASHDVAITPTLAQPPIAARSWHTRSWIANLQANTRYAPFPSAWNLADAASAAVPMGTSRGLPLSVMVTAPNGHEATVLQVLAELERLAPWTRHAPLV
ncbi:MAG: amidase [Actinobacteria bacterium]|nr:amidase [Actinomycetota bacterium]